MPRLILIMSLMVMAGPALCQDPVATTQVRLRDLASALESCRTDIGDYVGLEELDDRLVGSGIPAGDLINSAGGPWRLNPATGAFGPSRQPVDSDWQGPYVIYDPHEVANTSAEEPGVPLDSWARPILFHSPLGRIRADLGRVTLDHYADGFDRMTLLSLGPDGVMGGGDDLVLQFGPAPTGPALADLQGEGTQRFEDRWQARAGGRVRLRGYGLGSSVSDNRLEWGLTVLHEVSSWGDTRILFTLPSDQQGHDDLIAIRDGLNSNGLPLELIIPRNASESAWTFYR